MCYKVSDCKTDIAPFHSSFLPFLGDFFTWTLDMFFSLRHLSQKQNYSNITIFSWKYLATHKKVLIIHYQTLRYKLQPFKCTFLGVNQSNTCSLLSKKLLFCCFKATFVLLIKKVFWPKFAQKWQSQCQTTFMPTSICCCLSNCLHLIFDGYVLLPVYKSVC